MAVGQRVTTPEPPPVPCSNTDPIPSDGSQPSIREHMCAGLGIPYCDEIGQNDPVQGRDLRNRQGECDKVNICHGTGGDTFVLNTPARSSITAEYDSTGTIIVDVTGHGGSDHSDRGRDKVDYFPGWLTIPNPNGAGYPPAKLDVVPRGGSYTCGAVCTLPDTDTRVDCSCALEMTCIGGGVQELIGSDVDADGDVNCHYGPCPECPATPVDGHPDYADHSAGHTCVLIDSDPSSCDYHCCPQTGCPNGEAGTCTFSAVVFQDPNYLCDYTCDCCKFCAFFSLL